MNLALTLLTIVAVICAASALATRWRMSAPLLLVILGVIGSYLPFIPPVRLIPEMVLIGILPPLLYAAALRTPVVQFRALKRPIALLSVGYVIFGTVTIGLVVAWLIPEVPLPAAFALGAVVAPPDAVAATSIARRVGMPRRAVAILEGESLVNDATALVLLRSSVAALAGSISLLEIAFEFVVAAAGGALIGACAALVLLGIRRRVRNVPINTATSLAAPFVAFLPAEALHTSGVLAVVVAGLIIGTRTPSMPGSASRLSQRTNWATVQFLLENAVFLLIGLQVRSIVDAALMDPMGPARVWTVCGIILLAVIVLRPVWVFPASYLPRLLPRIRTTEPPLPWQFPAVVAWAGMRGVVTLAAVFVLPEDIPHRPVLILAALVVAAGTLAIQGFSLPWVVRRLGLRGPDRREDALQRALLVRQSTAAGLGQLEGRILAEDSPELLGMLRRRTKEWSAAAWERLGPPEEQLQTPSQRYFELRMVMLDAERREVLKLRRQGLYAAEVVDEVLERLDSEEAMLETFLAEEADEAGGTVPAVGPAALADPRDRPVRDGCAHLQDAPERQTPAAPRCLDCAREGTTPVHLRMCLECGEVACCESSPGLHADRHFRNTGHPLMRSVEPGESWRWCYLDEVLG
ncbi:cation:proton antiporter [Arthrobacter sp. MSA 4-2]|uniref:cation:proton antiporter domain-containing protein n=1 Tax=Arthrobacter sp. MSA 4-2 TaxID=2794349 RepID=UPI0018E74A72|nr:cation:proton antiporter [Arthrobacter sp. MSA 4-2]MBJ2121853.1 cation:proton antiporter [Arthrobacter sp. MSA 4-2]